MGKDAERWGRMRQNEEGQRSVLVFSVGLRSLSGVHRWQVEVQAEACAPKETMEQLSATVGKCASTDALTALEMTLRELSGEVARGTAAAAELQVNSVDKTTFAKKVPRHTPRH